MARSRVLRAVRRADGSYRIAVEPEVGGIDVLRGYTAAEVEQLAAGLAAEVRWVAAVEGVRSADLFGGPLPAGDDGDWDDPSPDAAPSPPYPGTAFPDTAFPDAGDDGTERSADLWGGPLPPGDED
jgi:hypothetical protein